MIDYDKINKWTSILDDLKNGVISNWYERLPKGIDVEKAIRKWKPVLESLNITDEEKSTKIAVYAEQHQRLESFEIINNNGYNLLPISIKVLSKLDNFEITDDPRLVETYQVSVTINRHEIEYNTGIDIMPRLENVLVEELINQLRGKKVLVYKAASSLLTIDEVQYVVGTRMILTSRIKVMD